MEVLIAIFFLNYIHVNWVKFRRVSKQVISLIRLFSTEPGHKQADLGIIKAKNWPGLRGKPCIFHGIFQKKYNNEQGSKV